MSLLFEAITAALLTARFAVGYDMGLVRAIELGVFHAISAFNNAGFALFSDNLIVAADPWIRLPIAAAVILAGSGSRCSSSCGDGCSGHGSGACTPG